ncbi:MAG: hypothetical protein ORN85_06620 [Sediminibacterium sp.]|nr:hypothetical protein [Sediminibacterium sp.]
MLKKIAILIFCIASQFNISFACDVCKRANERKMWINVGHGSGADNWTDFIWIFITAIITIYTLFFSIKYLYKPEEKSPQHIKYSIFQ